MMIVAIAWMYVALMMALAEAFSPQGSVLGAVITFFLYGVLPLGIVLYVMATPARRRAHVRKAKQAACADPDASGAVDPDRGGHAAGDAVAAKREEA